MPSTRPLPAELLAEFPQLEPRTTVRLHPTAGVAPVDASKMGGEILWPVNEQWPRCDEHHCVFVPVLQITEEDVPELGFVGGADVFQLLWCPTFHGSDGGPASRTFWRARSTVGAVAPTPAHPGRVETYLGEVDAWYIPRPCRLAPERTIELPSAFDLDPGLVAEIDEWLLGHLDQWFQEGRILAPTSELVERFEGRPPSLYAGHFSVAPGTKVGGYVNWFQYPRAPRCPRGHPMEHLLSVMNYESDPGDWMRWFPEGLTVPVPSGMEDARAVVSVRLICRSCPERPEVVEFDST